MTELNSEEGRALFDKAARRHMGISGEEFLALWDRREVDFEDPAVIKLALLIPFARPVPTKEA